MHFEPDCCAYAYKHDRSERDILLDARAILRAQAEQRHADRLRKARAALREAEGKLDDELAQIDKVLGL